MAEIESDQIVMIAGHEKRSHDLTQWLEPFGWRLDLCVPEKFVPGGNYSPSLIILDGTLPQSTLTRLVDTIRSGDAAAAAGPILVLCRPDMADTPGTSARIDLPLAQSDALAVIENWTGPLGDHGFRTLDNPHYRLVRLAGWERANRLLSAFVRHLKDALTALEEGKDIRRTAHIVAGLAGPMGFTDLSALWSAVERDDSNGIDAAIAAAHDVTEQVSRWIGMDKSGTA